MSEASSTSDSCCSTGRYVQKRAAGSQAGPRRSPKLPQSRSKRTQSPQSPAAGDIGRWLPAFQLPHVAIHTHVLPDGKVLFWGRRPRPDDPMDPVDKDILCWPFVWDPETGESIRAPQPRIGDTDATTVNLFCSGHSFLADGRLLVAGGHIQDVHGDDQACLYDWRSNSWEPLPPMVNGRWYPSAVTLGDGSILVCSGSYFDGVRHTPNNDVPQIWDGLGWRSLAPHQPLSLYPRFHLAPDGRVFVCGTNAECFLLDTAGSGRWTSIASRTQGPRDYAPSVMYDDGKVIYIGGGGGNSPPVLPSDQAEIIDLNQKQPKWQPTSPMHYPRRQHNATLLPDGTILVTGGSKAADFNRLGRNDSVYAAELWD